MKNNFEIYSAATCRNDNVSNYSPANFGASNAGASMTNVNACASLEGRDTFSQGEVVHKKRGRKRKRNNSGGEENIYRKVGCLVIITYLIKLETKFFNFKYLRDVQMPFKPVNFN